VVTPKAKNIKGFGFFQIGMTDGKRFVNEPP
jgi:hypothetical protein